MRIQKKTGIILHDLIMSIIAWQFAWWARFNFSLSYESDDKNIYLIPLVILIPLILFLRFRLYCGIWRFVSIADLRNIFHISILSALSITLICFILFRLEGIPRSVLILYPFFFMFFLSGPRLAYRVWKEHNLYINAISGNKRVLIIGAGRAAEILVREIIREGQYIPIGLLDNNAKLNGFDIHGISVLGEVDRVDDVCKAHAVDIILIAIPSASSSQMRAIVEKCENTGLPIKTLPSLQDMTSVVKTLPELREVSIEDLLGREKIELNWSDVQQVLANKTVLVTGGGGSVGRELCLQISKLNPERLIIFERNEFNLYKIEQQLSHSFVNTEYVLGDLCELDKVDSVFSQYKPQIIFHAAAYKHVPILERDVREAIRNNIIGTKHVADMADKFDSEQFVLISTDKAVNPTNVLGFTKRVAELYIENMNANSKTNYFTVRFGNVLGSDGSVIPLFHKQIKKGGPVTVTHPDITRYFMTVREACQLILQTSKMASGGEIYVLDMGEPIKINYLAEQMIRLSGSVPNKDIMIEYTGLRPGEKMHEELFYESEVTEKTLNDKIFLAKYHVTNLNEINTKLKQMIASIHDFDNHELKKLLKNMVLFLENKTNNVVELDQYFSK